MHRHDRDSRRKGDEKTGDERMAEVRVCRLIDTDQELSDMLAPPKYFMHAR